MKYPVDYCGEATWHQKRKTITKGLEVINDCAEYRVKFITDFKDSVTNKQEQHYLFQVIKQPLLLFHLKDYNKTNVQNMLV